MSDEFGRVSSIMSFGGRLVEEIQVQMGAFDKSVKTYNLSAILEITVLGLEGKAKRLMVSRHSDFISGPKASK